MTQVVLWFQYQLSRNSSDLWGLVSKARERARARALWRSPWTQPRINLKWCLYIGFNKKNRDASINTSKNIWAWFEFLILIPVETIWRGESLEEIHGFIYQVSECIDMNRSWFWQAHCLIAFLSHNCDSGSGKEGVDWQHPWGLHFEWKSL